MRTGGGGAAAADECAEVEGVQAVGVLVGPQRRLHRRGAAARVTAGRLNRIISFYIILYHLISSICIILYYIKHIRKHKRRSVPGCSRNST